MALRPIPKKSRFRSQEFIGGAITSLEQGYLVAYIHGGSAGRPGPAGYGLVVEDEIGRPVAQLSEFVGRKTISFAEYSGLLAALSYTLRHGFKALRVVSDSEVMVKQINGESKVTNPSVKQLHAQSMELISKLDYCEIRYLQREKNREADRLANLAIDRGIAKKAPAIAASDVGGLPSIAAELNGVVRGGVVHFAGKSLPDGTVVKIRGVSGKD